MILAARRGWRHSEKSSYLIAWDGMAGHVARQLCVHARLSRICLREDEDEGCAVFLAAWSASRPIRLISYYWSSHWRRPLRGAEGRSLEGAGEGSLAMYPIANHSRQPRTAAPSILPAHAALLPCIAVMVHNVCSSPYGDARAAAHHAATAWRRSCGDGVSGRHALDASS
jgi:hypothetical protein